MFLSCFLLIIGFIILIKSADYFIEDASILAKKFHISKVLIGVIILGFGTSLPELGVSISSAISNNADIILGNVIGSNIINILLILGITSIIMPIAISKKTIKRELPFLILFTSILSFLFIDSYLFKSVNNNFTRFDASILLIVFSVFIIYMIYDIKNNSSNDDTSEEIKNYKTWTLLLFLALELAGISLGSNMVVNNASFIAEKIGISQRVISLSIIAFGTSLPELVTSIVSAKKKENELLIGNIIGSNMFNIGFVLTLPILILGNISFNSFSYIDIIFFLISTILLFLFSLRNKILSRLNGIILFLLFILYYVLVFIK